MVVKNYGALYATLSGLFFGLLGYFGVTVMNANISVSTMLFWRFTISALFIFFLLIYNPNSFKFKFFEVSKLLFYGIAFYGTTSILYFIATRYIGSGLAMVIFFTYPAVIMFVDFFLHKQKISKIYYLAILIILVGMLCLVKGSPFHFNFIGLVIGLLSAIFYAICILISKSNPLPPLLSTFWISVGAAVTCFCVSLIDNKFVVPTNVTVWLNLCGIGIICTALPIIFLLKGLKHISSLQASILSVLEPVFVVIFGILLLGEQLSFTQGLGVVVILSGALLTLLNNPSPQSQTSSLES